jgi:hypothetical protein
MNATLSFFGVAFLLMPGGLHFASAKQRLKSPANVIGRRQNSRFVAMAHQFRPSKEGDTQK